ncbi:MAG: hypothetical protein HY833_02465 [Candidatus Aenigmarchaeota archaeon]|nr:hypothetical protein [Candidatus Aenigmarchaeota archaeon]
MGKVRDVFCGDGYSPVIDSETGEICCGNCGFVAGRDEGNIFGRKSEAYDEDHVVKHDAPLDTDVLSGTYISNTNVDFTGKTIPVATRYRMKPLRKMENRDRRRDRNRNVSKAIERIHKIGATLKMAEAHMEEALDVYKSAWERDIVKRRSFDSSVAASLMCILRKYEVPISFEDVASASGIKRKRIIKSYTAIRRNMDDIKVTELPSLSKYVSDIVGASRLPEVKRELYRREVMENIQYLRDAGYLGGLKPSGVAGAVAYATQRYNREWEGAVTQPGIESAVDVTMPTVRRGVEVFKKALDRLYAERSLSENKDKPQTLN